MSKTPFSKKVEILGTFYVMYSDDESIDEGWQDFIAINDIGLPLAFLAYMKVATITRPDGVNYVDATWDKFCANLGIDSEQRYADLQDVFDTSNRNRSE